VATGKLYRQRGSKGFGKPVGDPRDARGLYAAMRRFIEYRAIAGSTESGLYSSERYIRDFIAWADARAVTHPEHVSQAVLERYQRYLHHYRKKDGAPLSIASRRSKITPLRSFFKWLTKTGYRPTRPRRSNCRAPSGACRATS
jgi:integrase/recombinase XerD